MMPEREELLDEPLPTEIHTNYGNPINPVARTFICVVFAAPAIAASTVSLGFLFFCVLILYGVIFLRQGRITDIAGHRSRKYTGPIPFKFGKWQPFHDPMQIMVSRDSKRAGGTYVMMTDTTTDVFYDVDLVLDEDTFLTVGRMPNYQAAISMAQQLADHFDKELNDITADEV